MPTTEALLAETRWLTKLAHDLVGDPHAAEDVVQDTMLAALGDPQRPRRIQKLRPWLQAVARNFAFRRRQRDKQRIDAEQKSCADHVEALPSAAEAVERASVHRSVVDAVLGLDEPYRSTIVLRYLEDLSLAEVASRTGVLSETVRTRQKRGIAILRRRLDKLYRGDRQAWCLTLLPSLRTPSPTAVTAGGSDHVIGDFVGNTVGSHVSKVAGITGALTMTMSMKTKLAAVAVVCGTVVATFWALGLFGEELPPGPTGDAGGGRLGAEGEGPASTKAGSASNEASESTEVPRQPLAKPELGSLLVQAIWADDKKPAAGVVVSTQRDNPLFDLRARTADQHGRLRIENLKPGRIFVSCRRGEYGKGEPVTITAGKETQVQIEIPDGLNLNGIVVDQAGSPVANADIIALDLVGMSGGYTSLAPITKSNADGRFRLRDISVGCYVGARARGHAPSPLHEFFAAKGNNLTVRIVMGGSGGRVSGRVLDPLGKPVPNAVVQIGEYKPYPRITLPGGGSGIPPAPVRIRTDADGQFIAVGLTPGRLPVAVWGKGLAPWLGAVDIAAGGDSELVVHLLPAATLSGTARDGDGKPLEKVWVRAVSRHSKFFGDRTTGTDVDGNYRLAGLGPGKLRILATTRQRRAATELVAIAGQTVQWDPVLREGVELRGRAVDEQGRPVAQLQVSANLDDHSEEHWSVRARTNKEGRFVLKGCLPGKRIQIWVRAGARNFPTVTIMPDHKDLVIRVPALGLPSVNVFGQVLDPDGKPVEECHVTLRDREHSYMTPSLMTEVGTGRFKHKPCPPGEYRLSIRAKGYPMIVTDWKKLNKDDTWDLGVIHLQRPGFLRVNLIGETHLLSEQCTFSVHDAAMRSFGWVQIRNGKADPSSPIAPGTYYLQVLDKNILCARHKFEIQAGRETHLNVPLERATRVVLDFVLESEGKLVRLSQGWTVVEIKDKSGHKILKTWGVRLANDNLARRLQLEMRPGKYQVNASSYKDRARAEATITVGNKPAAPQRIVLR